MAFRKTQRETALCRALPLQDTIKTGIRLAFFALALPLFASCDALSPEVINTLTGLIGTLPAPNTGSGGLGGGVGGGAPAPNPPLNQVPTPPPAAAPDPAALLATGRAFFDQMCAVCHGSNGEGGVVDPTPLGPGLCTVAGSGSCQDVATLKTYIGTAMPSTAAPCPADCAEATAALIMNFNARALTASVNAGPAFDTHCSSCHSRDGTGVAAWLTPDTCNTVDCSDIYALSNFVIY
ncbi:MAG: cytochrome c [Gammaproteobacteria bacterium]